MNNSRSSFTGKIGFVLAAAGSAVGLGNLWRFPYLAGKYGGGIFVFCYVALAILFGFILLMLEIARSCFGVSLTSLFFSAKFL